MSVQEQKMRTKERREPKGPGCILPRKYDSNSASGGRGRRRGKHQEEAKGQKLEPLKIQLNRDFGVASM